MSRQVRCFRRLVRLLFPEDFRVDYEADMERTFRAQQRDARAAGATRLVRLWGETLADLFRTAPRQHVDQLQQDVRYAARAMARRPAFSAVTAAVFAIGIGATTAVFAVFDAAILRPVPFDDPARLVAVREQPLQEAQLWELSYPLYQELARNNRSFERLAAYNRNGVVIGGPEPVLTDAAVVSASLLDTLRASPLAGRSFTSFEDAPGGAAVALIREELAIARFGSTERAVGAALTIDDRPTTIVGVLPGSFRFPAADVDVWLPIGQSADQPWMRNRAVHLALVVGRLRAGTSLDAARAELDARMAAAQAREPAADPGHRLVVRSLAEHVSVDARPAVTALAFAVLLLLGVTCSSVGLLLLTRAAGRSNEVAVRLSLGASRARIVRQLLTEVACLATVGAALGVATSYAMLGVLVRGLNDALPPYVVPTIDNVALAASAITTGAAALVAGLAPAARALAFVRAHASSARSRQPLVVAQVAVSCVLLIVAALLAQTMDRVLRVDLGFRADRLLVMRVTAPSALYQGPGDMTRFYRTVFERVRRLPGIAGVAFVSNPPVKPGSQGDLTIEGQPLPVPPVATYRRVLPGYFSTLGMPLVEGRDFSERDGAGEPVTIVSANLARRFWPPGQAVGKRLKAGPADREPWLRIVGVVGDVRNGALEAGADLATYEPHRQRPWNGMFIMVRTAGEPTAMTGAVNRALREVEPQVLISDTSTMDARIAESVASRRFHAIVVGAFAATTLLLVALAVYGVLGYWVASRTRELGIRMAVGATAPAVVRVVVGEGLRPTLAGVVLGLVAAAAAASAGRALLFDVRPHDPPTYAFAAALVVVVTLASSWLPARRASRIDPSVALRSE